METSANAGLIYPPRGAELLRDSVKIFSRLVYLVPVTSPFRKLTGIRLAMQIM